MSKYKVVASETLYKGHIVRLVKDRFVFHAKPETLYTRELLIHPGAVVILPFVDKKRILLIRQFRYAAKGDLWEIPAGTINPRENPLRCAKRELEEETGFKASQWRKLTRFIPAPGISDEWMTLFEASNLRAGKQHLDHDEWIDEQRIVTIPEALRLVEKKEICDGKTIIGILWASRFKR